MSAGAADGERSDKKTMLIKKKKHEESESQNSNGVWMAFFFCLFVVCLFVCFFSE